MSELQSEINTGLRIAAHNIVGTYIKNYSDLPTEEEAEAYIQVFAKELRTKSNPMYGLELNQTS